MYRVGNECCNKATLSADCMSVRWLVMALGLLSGATPSFAYDAPPEVRACMVEDNDARRLACYDKQLGRRPHGTSDTPDTARPAHFVPIVPTRGFRTIGSLRAEIAHHP